MKKFHIDDASLSRSGSCFRLVGNFLHFAGKPAVTSQNVDHFLRLGILLMKGYDSWTFVGPAIIVYSLVCPLSTLHTHSILWIRHSHLLKLHLRRNKKSNALPISIHTGLTRCGKVSELNSPFL